MYASLYVCIQVCVCMHVCFICIIMYVSACMQVSMHINMYMQMAGWLDLWMDGWMDSNRRIWWYKCAAFHSLVYRECWSWSSGWLTTALTTALASSEINFDKLGFRWVRCTGLSPQGKWGYVWPGTRDGRSPPFPGLLDEGCDGDPVYATKKNDPTTCIINTGCWCCWSSCYGGRGLGPWWMPADCKQPLSTMPTIGVYFIYAYNSHKHRRLSGAI